MTGCVKEGGDIRFRWSEFKPHLQKTFIGKKEHDFEFLGYFIKPGDSIYFVASSNFKLKLKW